LENLASSAFRFVGFITNFYNSAIPMRKVKQGLS
jgi:hypothetical protein